MMPWKAVWNYIFKSGNISIKGPLSVINSVVLYEAHSSHVTCKMQCPHGEFQTVCSPTGATEPPLGYSTCLHLYKTVCDDCCGVGHHGWVRLKSDEIPLLTWRFVCHLNTCSQWDQNIRILINKNYLGWAQMLPLFMLIIMIINKHVYTVYISVNVKTAQLGKMTKW